MIFAFQLQSLISFKKVEISWIQKFIDRSYTITTKSVFRKHDVRTPRCFSCPEVSQMCTLEFSSQIDENSRPMVLLDSRGKESQRRRWTREVFPEDGGPVKAILSMDFCISYMKKIFFIGVGFIATGLALGDFYMSNPLNSTRFFLQLSNRQFKSQTLRLFLLNRFIQFYGVDRSEIIQPLQSFMTFSEFFTRRVSGIEFDKKKETICSPANSQIISIGKVQSNQAQVVAKGKTYSINKFLGYNLDFANQSIYQVVFYLSPADCHRFFSPCPLQLTNISDLGGIFKCDQYNVSRHPVTIKAISANPNIYTQNYRRIARGISSIGEVKLNVNLAFVGAVNVGGIDIFTDTNNKHTYQKGSAMGVFKIGSTIVMLVEVPKDKQLRVLREKGKVRAGQAVLELI